MKSYLNLGCGTRYHPDWLNIDIAPQNSEIIQHDLSKGIPLPDGSCYVVYHSAVLEHMHRADALNFLEECHRVLQSGGIIRVGVPDLEILCSMYLQKLEAALTGDRAATNDYDWIILELYDQTVREQSGGDMVKYLRQDPIPNESFVYTRIGEEGRELVQKLRQLNRSSQPPWTTESASFYRRLHRKIVALPDAAVRCLQRWLLDADDMRALKIGHFRQTGEVHLWMYDRFSLSRMLEEANFCDPKVQDATSSMIPDWSAFHLDTLPDGSVIKPDLIFMEATKNEA